MFTFLLTTLYRHLYAKTALGNKSVSVSKSSFVSKVVGSLEGWKFYFHHSVRNAGLGLAFLFMTVLGFDPTTWAYSLMQCVPESILGILLAVSALVGILGTLVFPFLRRASNTETAGLTGMTCLISALSLCVISVWLPGSPFVLYPDRTISLTNSSHSNQTENYHCNKREPNMTSVSVLLTGIILARFGLWISDLSITQIVQENVQENKRGLVGGVQNSLNSRSVSNSINMK